MRAPLTIAAAGVWLYLAGTVAPAVAAPADPRSVSPSSSDHCIPAVQVEGEAPLAEAFVQELTARGLKIDGRRDCTLRVWISSGEEGFLIEMEDMYGRRSARQVHTLAIGAVLVESWTRIEVQPAPPHAPPATEPAPLREPAGAATAPAAEKTGNAQTGAPDGSPSAAVPPAAPAESEGTEKTKSSFSMPLTVAVLAGPSVSNDGSSWLGGALTAAMPVGSFRLGGGLQVHADPGWTGATSDAQSARAAINAIVKIEYRVPLGRWDLLPGALAGVGLLHAWPQEQLEEEERVHDEDTVGMQLGGQLTVRRRLRPGVAFIAELALQATPFEHTFLRKDEVPTLLPFPEGMIRTAIGIEIGGP